MIASFIVRLSAISQNHLSATDTRYCDVHLEV